VGSERGGGSWSECALIALARPISICLIRIYRLCLAEFGGGVTRHLALVPSVSPAFSPPVDLNSVE
jgi:hypothetical protein